MIKRNKVFPLIPALFSSCFDVSITAIYQPKSYWQGDLSNANEGNPLGYLFMNWHQSGLFIISAIWIFAIILLGYYLPKKIATIFLLFVLISHSFGAGSWLNQNYGFFSAILFFLLNAALWEYFNSISFKKRSE